MSYLLDTNIVIAALNDRPAVTREYLDAALRREQTVSISSIVYFELVYGTARSKRQHQNLQALAALLAGKIDILAFDDQDAEAAGRLRSTLEAAGCPIGPFDILIAGQALRRKATLVTANAREFGRIAGLTCEDWTKAG